MDWKLVFYITSLFFPFLLAKPYLTAKRSNATKKATTETNLNDIFSRFTERSKGWASSYGEYPMGTGACSLDPMPQVYTQKNWIKVAAGAPNFQSSLGCGTCLKIEASGKPVGGQGNKPLKGTYYGVIVNLCEACGKGDLGFYIKGNGKWEITFDAVDCPDVAGPKGNIQYRFSGAKNGYLKLQITNAKLPTAAVEFFKDGKWHCATRATDNHFTLKGVGEIKFPVKTRLTSIAGETVGGDIPKLINNKDQDSGLQYKSFKSVAGDSPPKLPCHGQGGLKRPGKESDLNSQGQEGGVKKDQSMEVAGKEPPASKGGLNESGDGQKEDGSKEEEPTGGGPEEGVTIEGGPGSGEGADAEKGGKEDGTKEIGSETGSKADGLGAAANEVSSEVGAKEGGEVGKAEKDGKEGGTKEVGSETGSKADGDGAAANEVGSEVGTFEGGEQNSTREGGERGNVLDLGSEVGAKEVGDRSNTENGGKEDGPKEIGSEVGTKEEGGGKGGTKEAGEGGNANEVGSKVGAKEVGLQGRTPEGGLASEGGGDSKGGENGAFCKNKESGIYADPNDCTSFIQCTNNKQTYKTKCSKGLEFNTNIKTCDWPTNSGCSKRDSPSINEEKDETDKQEKQEGHSTDSQIVNAKVNWCSKYQLLDGKHAYPTDCKKYINCTGNETSVFQCPHDSLYDRKQKNCEAAEFVDCSDRLVSGQSKDNRVSLSGATSGSQNNDQATPSDSQKTSLDLQLTGPNSHRFSNDSYQTSPDPQQTSPDVSQIRSESQQINAASYHFSQDSHQTDSIRSQFCQGMLDGYYPIKSHCNSFYKCSKDNTQIKSCPTGLQFNPDDGVCDWPKHVKCDH